MDYQRIYSEFIADRKAKPKPDGYTERHHIQPRALGGSDDAANLIYLTAREHYFAHCCLAKIYGGKMWSALFAVANMAKTDEAWRYFCRRRMVEAARSMAAIRRSEQMTELWATGKFKRNRIYRPWTEAEREQRSRAAKGRTNSRESIARGRETRQSKAASFRFIHVDGRTYAGTALNFREHSGLSQSMVSYLTRRRILSAKGWMIEGVDKGSIRGRDGSVRNFTHRSGKTFVGTVFDFRSAHPYADSGSLSKLINGKLKTVNGWKLTSTTEQSG